MTADLAECVFLDTSIWIDYFRKKDSVFDRVEHLIDAGRVCTARLVVAELLQGAKSDSEFLILQDAVLVFRVLEERPDTWIQAAKLSKTLRSKGKTIGLADCYLAVLAHHYRVPFWTQDHHFTTIQSQLQLDLYSPLS